MGLLTLGKPLTLEEAKKHLAYVRSHGIQQFLHTWNRVRDIENVRYYSLEFILKSNFKS